MPKTLLTLAGAPHPPSGQDQIQLHDGATDNATVQDTPSLFTNVCELHQIAVQAGDDLLLEPNNDDHSECNSSSLEDEAEDDIVNGMGFETEV